MKKIKQLMNLSISVMMLITLFFTMNFNVKAVTNISVSDYGKLHEALKSGATSIILENDIEAATLSTINESEALSFDDGTTKTIDFNSKTITSPNDGNNYYRAFLVYNSELNLKNGSIVAGGSGTNKENGKGSFGSVYAENSILNLTDMKFKNSRPWGLNIKTENSTTVLKGVSIDSSYGGGLEIAGGEADIYTSNFTQKNSYDHCSTNIAVSTGGELNVYSGTYSSENYGAYIFNSGGTINIYGGNFSAGKAVLKADKSTTKYPSKINVSGGSFSGPISIADGAILNISGGSFTSIGLSKEKFSTYVDLNEYKVIENNGVFNVVPKIESIEIEQENPKVQLGKKLQLTVKITPTVSSEKITWGSSDLTIATVDGEGVVTGKKEGKVTITATAAGKVATCEVQVYEIEKPVLPPPPVNDGKDTTIEVNEKTTEVLTDTIKEIVDNVEEATGVSPETKAALKEAIAAGKQISVEAKTEKVDAKKVETTVVKEVEKVIAKDAMIAQYFDLSMMIKADGSDLGTMNELSSKASFTVSVPTDLTKDGRTFYMVRIHDGVAEKIAGTLKGNEFTFESDKFSIYALVYEDTKAEEPGNEGETEDNGDTVDPGDKEETVDKVETEDKKDTIVDTSDRTNKDGLYSLLSLSILAMGVLVFKKKFSM